MGHLVSETHFLHVFWRLLFMARNWAVPVDEFWAESQDSVADHPYRPFLDLLVLPPQEAARFVSTLDGKFDLTSVEVSQLELMQLLGNLHSPIATQALELATIHTDDVGGACRCISATR